MKKIFYFAYGSNMSQDRLEFRVGEVRHAGIHRLKGYKFVFNCGWKGLSFANIVEGTEANFVEGVLYELTAAQIKQLDNYEGLYVRECFLLPNNEIGHVYIGEPRYTTRALPTKDYINTIIEGARANNLIATYNGLVRYKTDVMKLRSKHKLILI